MMEEEEERAKVCDYCYYQDDTDEDLDSRLDNEVAVFRWVCSCWVKNCWYGAIKSFN